MKKDWRSGLAHLAQCENKVLKDLATKELASDIGEPDSVVLVADAWWDASEREAEPIARQAMKVHATHLYESAAVTLRGLAKAGVEKRLAEVEAAGGLGPVVRYDWRDTALTKNWTIPQKAWQVTGNGLESRQTSAISLPGCTRPSSVDVTFTPHKVGAFTIAVGELIFRLHIVNQHVGFAFDKDTADSNIQAKTPIELKEDHRYTVTLCVNGDSHPTAKIGDMRIVGDTITIGLDGPIAPLYICSDRPGLVIHSVVTKG